MGQIADAPGGLETARALIAEADSIAAAYGYPTEPKFLDLINTRIILPGSPLTASMYRDMIRGYAVEADNILGDLLARGQAQGLTSPLLRAAYAQLSVYGGTLSKTL